LVVERRDANAGAGVRISRRRWSADGPAAWFAGSGVKAGCIRVGAVELKTTKMFGRVMGIRTYPHG
jgi:hypothetical protein